MKAPQLIAAGSTSGITTQPQTILRASLALTRLAGGPPVASVAACLSAAGERTAPPCDN